MHEKVTNLTKKVKKATEASRTPDLQFSSNGCFFFLSTHTVLSTFQLLDWRSNQLSYGGPHTQR